MDITLPMIGTGMGIVLGGFGTIKIMSNAQTKATKEEFTKEFVTKEKCSDSKAICNVHTHFNDEKISRIETSVDRIDAKVTLLNDTLIEYLARNEKTA